MMNRGDEVKILQATERSNKADAMAAPDVQGLAGWVLGRLRVWRGQPEMRRKQLRIVETLSLGGRRQLILVTCGGESFLVGGGMESVDAIVRLKAEVSPDTAAKDLDGICR
jgi:flagellar biogenesis protein FliO